ncbi:hypothetical protein J7444_08320 [Labrenzia sp. R4_1]|uniref:hypothetical protein n=1 Tax=Labrenzia sp. R4_1 TaxID=2821106 RepID=UPI001AD9CFDF|nr:hypothetical protein [Labrenzia sp. R4_1]MBO9424723.1 hypothetical protein [Labrenzia sp. R4_1]
MKKKRVTIERFIRNDDDETGNSERGWTITNDQGLIKIRGKTETPVLLIHEDDIEQLYADLLELTA